MSTAKENLMWAPVVVEPDPNHIHKTTQIWLRAEGFDMA